jgi:AraC-like DNA-binding protein
MNGVDAQEYTSLLENLERELIAWSPADCMHLLGVLERVRVSAWSKLLGSSRDSSQAAPRRKGVQLLTVPEIAKRLHCSRSTVKRRLREAVYGV